VARIRTIKPEFSTSPDTGNLSREARLFFLQLLPLLDDEGRARWLPKALAGELYPYDDDVDADMVSGWADECCAGCDPMLVRYSVDEHEYICSPKFLVHQRISHPAQSRHPAPPESSGVLPEDSGGLPEPSGVPPSGMEGNGRELGNRNGTGKSEVGEADGVLAAQAEAWCQLLADLMVRNGRKPPRVTLQWRHAAASLVALDKRAPEDVEAVLRWCQSPGCWWCSRIDSMPKFREKFDTLRLQQLQEKTPATNGHARASPESVAAGYRRLAGLDPIAPGGAH
jgi:hypothetical protein